MTVEPLRVTVMNDYEIVVKGLARMFAPFRDRLILVELVAGLPAKADCDIVLYETFAAEQGERLDHDSVLSHCRARRVVIYSWDMDPRLVEASLSGGASGYLSKTLSAEELVLALEKIHAGETVVSESEVSDTSPRHDPGDWPGRSEGLTEREAEIIALITQGLSNEEVAVRAFLSINTVKSYIRSSYRKMGVTSRSQALLWGIEHGFRLEHKRIQGPDNQL